MFGIWNFFKSSEIDREREERERGAVCLSNESFDVFTGNTIFGQISRVLTSYCCGCCGRVGLWSVKERRGVGWLIAINAFVKI